jgi:hypothetical protein
VQDVRTVLRLLPLVIVYVLIIVTYSQTHPGLVQGENRYFTDAEKLIERKTAVMRHDPVPWNGPGYPLFLVPFVILHAPNIVIRLSNAAVLFLGALYLFRTLRYYVREKWAYLAVYILGLYPVLLKYLPRLITEPISVFLACGLAFHIVHMNRSPDRRVLHMVLAGIYLGYMALTKVLFGYVIGAAIVVYLVALVVSRRRQALRPLLVACVALAVCVPYLYQNYYLTGKVFYWAQSGGLSLYWMSSPMEEEYGDWLTGTRPWLGGFWKAEKHEEFMESLQRLSPVERDDTLRKEAVRNIMEHPGKFARNWVANVTRLFLHYPFSYRQQSMKNLANVLLGSVLLVLCMLCAIPTVMGWRAIPAGIRQAFLIGLLYVGGNSLLSAYDRMLLPVFPFIALWVTYILANTLRPGFLRMHLPEQTL